MINMETTERYKDYFIDYSSMSGNTIVRDYYGFEIKIFVGYGEITGKQKAMQYIDSLV